MVYMKLIEELKKEQYQKYFFSFGLRLPFDKEQFRTLLKFNKQQSKVFKGYSLKNDPGKINLDIDFRVSKLFRNMTESDFQEAMDLVSRAVTSSIQVDILARAHLSFEKYITVPPLPTSFDKENEVFGTPILRGVTISFDKAKKDLKMVELGAIPCMCCDHVGIKVELFIRKKSRFTESTMISFLQSIEEYSKYFYKERNAK